MSMDDVLCCGLLVCVGASALGAAGAMGITGTAGDSGAVSCMQVQWWSGGGWKPLGIGTNGALGASIWLAGTISGNCGMGGNSGNVGATSTGMVSMEG